MLNSRTKLVLAALTLFAILFALWSISTVNPMGAAKAQGEERKLENLIPKHVPLAVKIRKEKEKEFKDLNNENWARDFELEVTNTGEKPIYEFYLTLVLDVTDASGQNVIAPVYYGRTKLGDHRIRATPQDIPLRAGESVILKIHPGQIQAWDIKHRDEGRQHPKKIQIKMDGLSFGDGTGYMGNDGILVPHKVGTPSDTSRCAPQKIPGAGGFDDWPVANGYHQANQLPNINLPASLLPVSFLLGTSSNTSPLNSKPAPDFFCCPSQCTSIIRYTEHSCYNCPYQTRFYTTGCSNPDGLMLFTTLRSHRMYHSRNWRDLFLLKNRSDVLQWATGFTNANPITNA